MLLKRNATLILSFLITISTLVWIFGDFGEERAVLLLEKYEDNREIRNTKEAYPLRLAYGWSENSDVIKAADEAIYSLTATIPSPSFILTFYTEPYDAALIQRQKQKQLPGCKILGMQSARGVFSPDGLHNSSDGAVVMLGFYSEDFVVGVAGSQIAEAGDHIENGFSIIEAARDDAGVDDFLEPSGIISAQVMGYSELYCDVLNKSFLKETPMIGGNAITSAVTLGSIIVNDEVYSSGFAVALLFTDKKIGADFHGGFSGRIKSGIVTSISGKDKHVIEKIDYRPAVEVYNEWAENRFSEFLNREEPVIVNKSVLSPLSKSIMLENGGMQHITLHPWRFHPDGSISVGVAVDIGEEIYYVEGDEDILVERSGAVARKAMINGGIPITQVAGGVHIYCVGAGMHLGIGKEGRATEIVDELNSKMSGQPFIGGFFGGEQGTVQDHGFFAGNLMSAMMIFSKEE